MAVNRYPLVTVVQTGKSPLNPTVKWALLSCGHDRFGNTAGGINIRKGSKVFCEQCPPVEEK